MSPMQTPAEHLARNAQQLEALKVLKKTPLDIFCLQEVNPLPFRLDEIEKALDLCGGSCVVNAGVKLGGFGLPPGLREGLAIIPGDGFENKNFHELTLSGSAKEFAQMVFQLSERRKAFLFEGSFEGKKVGVVNLHLHHGPDTNSENLQRKKSELQRLAAWIETRMDSWDISAVCGDFNCVAESPAMEPLLSLGFQDTAQLAGIHMVPTWDPSVNAFAKLSSTEANTSETKTWDATPQVLDRIYLKTKVSPHQVSVTQIREPELSDHFGVCAELRY